MPNEYVRVSDLNQCETCRHNRFGGCDTWCECGEAYTINWSKITQVDAVEVVRARWIDRYGGQFENPIYVCSACGEKALYKLERDCLGGWHEVQALTPVCPNCGAKMDGERRE